MLVNSLFFQLIAQARRNKLSIFCFHSVADNPSPWLRSTPALNISCHNFNNLVSIINSTFHIISPALLLNHSVTDITASYDSPCILTFDDGYYDTFDFAIPYLVKSNIPSLHFLNTANILNSSPILSSFVDFVFTCPARCLLASKLNLSPPYYLSITPPLLSRILSEIPLTTFEMSKLNVYAPRPPSVSQIQEFSDNSLVFYASHLDEHWNSNALNDDQFVNSLSNSLNILSGFSNFLPFLSFPNGVPQVAFTEHHLSLASSLGITRTFGVHHSLTSPYVTNSLPRINIGFDGVFNNLSLLRLFTLSILR